MLETQLRLGNSLLKDKQIVYDQMKAMKEAIASVSRKQYETDNCKENFDDFKVKLSTLCDEFVAAEKERIDKTFASL